MERERKRKAKEEEKIAKEKNKQQKRKDKQNVKTKRSRKRKQVAPPEESDSECSVDIVYDDEPPQDLSFDSVNKDICFICKTENVEESELVGCRECPRFAHMSCTGDATLMSLTDTGDILDYHFLCTYCDFS